MGFKDEPVEVCRYDLMVFASEAKEYASRWETEQAFSDNATSEEREYLIYLVSGAGESVAMLYRADEKLPEHWRELRAARNQYSHTYTNRPYGEAWRLASGLLGDVASELSRELPKIPGYDRDDPRRDRHFQ